MSERLSRFTPNATGLDRDAILFAAGRRAARGSWAWKAAAGLLALSQAVTLVVLWPTEPPAGPPVAGPPPTAEAPAVPVVPPPASPPADLWTAGSRPDVLREPPRSTTVEFVESESPLTAGSGHRFN